MRNRIFTLLGSVVILAGCTVGPDFVRPTIPMKDTFHAEVSARDSIANLPWWELFGDPVLQELVSEALENNRDLRSSMARIDEARARTGIARSEMYPNVDVYAGAAEGGFGGRNVQPDDFTVQFLANYQVDLWGRIRRSNEAAVQDLLSTEEAYRSVTIALVAQVASTYFLLRDVDNRLLVSEQTAATWKHDLNAIRARYNAGLVSEVEVNQAEIQLADADAMVWTFQRIRGQTENTINLLLSKGPETIVRGLALSEQITTPEIPAGLPSELLDRRPDLRRAERDLHAQTARIGVAEALRFPSLNLGADLGAVFAGETDEFSGIGAMLAAPIFNAGKNKRQVEIEVARTEQLLNLYEQSFFTALREVEDAIIAVNTFREEFEIRKSQLRSAQNAAELSWIRYQAGTTNYLEVLDVQRSLFSTQLATSETLQRQLSSMVQLYEALGGGWSPAVSESTTKH